MTIVAVESLTAALEEIKPLFPQIWAELEMHQDKMPLDPDYDYYLAMDAAGRVLFITLRDQGIVVGLWVQFIAPHPHHRNFIFCTSDILWIHPKYRNADNGTTLAYIAKTEIRRRGVQVWVVGSKKRHDIGGFLRNIGMEPEEVYYSMWVGE